MKPIFAAVAVFLITLPAASQGNNHSGIPPAQPYSEPAYDAGPLSQLAQQAFDQCPGLISRTESAAANGHTQYYYSYDCECMARAIDNNTWNESSAVYDGPKMPSSDAYAIIGALASSPTIEDAFSAVDSNVSEVGYSAISACYGK